MSKYPGRIVTDLAPAGYSVFFDGTGDSLTISSSGVGPTGTETFCFEVWMNASSFGGNFPRIFEGTTINAFQVYLSGGTLTVSQNGGSTIFTYALTGLTNQWLHICVTRNSANSQMRLFINGVLRGYTASGGTNFVSSTVWQSANEGSGIVGYLSNMRIVRGSIPVEYQTSVTTTGTSVFTPPTQLFNVPGTSFLACNSPAIIDQSNNAYAIAVGGNAAVSTFTPFTAYVPYNPALGASTPGVWALDEALQARATRQWNMYDPSFNLTTLLLHGNGTNGAQNNTFLDSSSNNFTITRNGNTTQGSFSPFSQTGWGVFFNGSSTISLPSNAAFNLSSGTWTFEGFFYLTAAPAKTCRAMMIGTNNNLNSFVLFAINTDLTFGCGVPAAGTGVGSGTTTLPLNQWNHVAIVMNGSTGSVYLNGTRVGNQTGVTQMNNVSAALTIGQDSSEVTVNAIYAGYMASVRIVKGVALYSGLTCTVPTSALTAVSGTSFLTFTQNRFVDLGSSLTMTLNGTPSIQAFSPFYSTRAYTPQIIGGSGYFDGTGDTLSIADNAALEPSNLNFCISFWIYPTVTGDFYVYGKGDASTATGSTFSVTRLTTSFYQSNNGSTLSHNSKILTNQWNYYVFCRDGPNLSVFINGNRESTTNALGSLSLNNVTNPLIVGGYTGSPVTGYMANFRYVVGSRVYDPTVSTITVPSALDTAITNTSLLLNFTNAGIVDSTAKNVLETVGNAQISTTQSKFGGTSMYFDGNGDNLLTTPNQVFDLGASDFTIEFWLYPVSTSAGTLVYSTSNRVKTDALAILLSGGNVLGYATPSGGSVWTIMSAANFGSVTINTWSHVALVRNGSSFRGYVNGVQSASLATTSSAITSFNGFSIGSNGAAADFLNGYIDDLRITRFARYTANFTPQTSQWQDE